MRVRWVGGNIDIPTLESDQNSNDLAPPRHLFNTFKFNRIPTVQPVINCKRE